MRLTAAILVVTWTVLAIVAFVINQAVDTSFRQYVGARNAALFEPAEITDLQAYYGANGTWAGAEPLLPAMGRGMGERRGGGGMQTFVASPDGVILAATNPELIGKNLDAGEIAQTLPLEVAGTTVGLLGRQAPGEQVLGRAEQAFSGQVGQALFGVGLVASLVAMALGLLLALWLAQPLQRLADHIRRMTSAQLGAPVPVEGPTEVQQLATSFNTLSARLAAGERLRQQMTSDVAHELRTPVSVLRGHLEAMMDGVYPLDAEHLAVAYDQTIHLARLVEDLRLLTQAESGRLPLEPAAADPATLIAEAAARFAPLAQDAGLALEHDAASGLPPVMVDRVRIQQIFDNLLTNAVRHTEEGGAIRMAAALTFLPAPDSGVPRRGVRFSVSNSGNLPPEHIEHLFDRFWRGSDAREADTGGSGLGLAITRQLVLRHGGAIAAVAEGGVTTFIIDLPA